MGIAIVAIKCRDDDGSKRLLARNVGNGNVLAVRPVISPLLVADSWELTANPLQNFRLQSSLTIKQEKNILSFLGFEGTTPTSFRLRIKTEDMAGEFKTQLDDAAGSK